MCYMKSLRWVDESSSNNNTNIQQQSHNNHFKKIMILTFQQQQNTTTHALTQWIACFAVFRSRREHVYGYFAFHRKQQKRNMFSMCWMISIVNHTNEYVTHAHVYNACRQHQFHSDVIGLFSLFNRRNLYILQHTHSVCLCACAFVTPSNPVWQSCRMDQFADCPFQ